MSWPSGLRRLTGDAKVEGSNPDTALILWQDINLHLLLSDQVLNRSPGMMRPLVKQLFWRQVMPGWNAPQSIESSDREY